MTLFKKKKPRICAVCGYGIEERCGLKYKLRVKRYAPNGFYSIVSRNGVVCEACLKTLKELILEAKDGGLCREEKSTAA